MRTGAMRIAEISVTAIRHNIERMRTVADGAALIAVVKANAYGHGTEIVARAALEGGARQLAVADLEEAFALRRLLPEVEVICWMQRNRGVSSSAVEAGIEIGVKSLAELEAVAAVGSRTVQEHVQTKLDTGLGSNGVSQENWERVFAAAARLESLGTLRV